MSVFDPEDPDIRRQRMYHSLRFYSLHRGAQGPKWARYEDLYRTTNQVPTGVSGPGIHGPFPNAKAAYAYCCPVLAPVAKPTIGCVYVTRNGDSFWEPFSEARKQPNGYIHRESRRSPYPVIDIGNAVSEIQIDKEEL